MKPAILTNTELKTLSELLLKLQEQRLQQYRDEGYDVDAMDDDEIVELDDGDNLISGINTVFSTVESMRGN